MPVVWAMWSFPCWSVCRFGTIDLTLRDLVILYPHQLTLMWFPSMWIHRETTAAKYCQIWKQTFEWRMDTEVDFTDPFWETLQNFAVFSVSSFFHWPKIRWNELGWCERGWSSRHLPLHWINRRVYNLQFKLYKAAGQGAMACFVFALSIFPVFF